MIRDVIEAINMQAEIWPDAIAYDYLGTTNTYRDLQEQSNRLAVAISERVEDRTQPILVYGGQTFQMIVAFLACVKSGHAYVPVDTDSSVERIESIMLTANPGLVIEVEELTVSTIIGKLTTRALSEILAKPVADIPLIPVHGDENFYIIFTSGTTGNPKGVQISHTNLLSFVNWMVTDFNYHAGNSLSQPPYSFDLSVMDLYPTLVNGGTLKVLPKAVTENFKRLFQILPQLELDNWVSTPTFMDICLMEPSFTAENYPRLNQFLFCGEELTKRTAQRLIARFPAAKIYNTYGPTEATVAISSVKITAELLQRFDRLPIGIVKDDTTVTIQPVDGADQAGEIVISGPSVSKGYLNNPTKTADVFGDHTYHTGDLGFLDETGMLFYRGRTDFQIKLNGYRIELEEINQQLANLPQLVQGVAVPKYARNGKVNKLIAIVKPATDVQDEFAFVQELKQSLADQLMPYMIPTQFILRADLPQSINGKVDIKALIAEVNNS